MLFKYSDKNMHFQDRAEAGKFLAKSLNKYKNERVVVYALPRGGVVTAEGIAKYLHAPLDLLITRKISHPGNPEYAVAAIAENGHILGNTQELMKLDEGWLEDEIAKQRKEVVRRRKKYMRGKSLLSAKDKVAIIVDDGAATGLTLRVGILEIKHQSPKKIVVAIPIVPNSTAKIIEHECDDLITINRPKDNEFLGSVGAYYNNFEQVDDNEVMRILDQNNARLQEEITPKIFSSKLEKHKND